MNRERGTAPAAVRLDTWLWAARFFKTRSLAAQAASGGKVEVNGVRAKPAKSLRVGDRLRVRKGPFEFVVTVLKSVERRVPAAEVALLYAENAEARGARERLAEQLRLAPSPRYQGKGRPTKKERREIERLSSRVETENRRPKTDDSS